MIATSTIKLGVAIISPFTASAKLTPLIPLTIAQIPSSNKPKILMIVSRPMQRDGNKSKRRSSPTVLRTSVSLLPAANLINLMMHGAKLKPKPKNRRNFTPIPMAGWDACATDDDDGDSMRFQQKLFHQQHSSKSIRYLAARCI